MKLFEPPRHIQPELERHGEILVLGAIFFFVACKLLQGVIPPEEGVQGVHGWTYAAQVIVAAPLLLLARRAAGGARVLGLANPGRGLLQGVMAYLAAVLPIMGATWAYRTYILTEEQARLQQDSMVALKQLEAGPELLLLAVGVTVVVPLFEELVFRGWLLNGLLGVFRRALSPRVATAASVVLSAAIFTLPHLRVTWLIVFLIGLAVGALYARTRSLWAALSFHACHNVWAFVYGRYIE